MSLSQTLPAVPAPPKSPGAQCVAVIRDLLDGSVDSLLDIGSGRVAPDYPYLDLAGRITTLRRWAHLYDSLLSWSEGLGRMTGVAPFRDRLAQGCAVEFERDYGAGSFNLAIALRKTGPAI